jgi:hypothetical protein
VTSIFSDKDPSNIKGINIGIGNAYCKSAQQRKIEDFMKNMSKNLIVSLRCVEEKKAQKLSSKMEKTTIFIRLYWVVIKCRDS